MTREAAGRKRASDGADRVSIARLLSSRVDKRILAASRFDFDLNIAKVADEREVPMTTTDGGAVLVEALHKAGVRRIFSVSGSGMATIYRCCAKIGIDVIHTRHEAAAAFMADATARVSGHPGVCLVTHGVGLTNASTGIATAWLDQSPTITLVGFLTPSRTGEIFRTSINWPSPRRSPSGPAVYLRQNAFLNTSPRQHAMR